MRSRRSAGADSDVTVLTYFPRYSRTPAYNWNQKLNLQLVPFQMWNSQGGQDEAPESSEQKRYPQIISKNMTDIGRTNLIQLDILTEGPPLTSKSYTAPLKYSKFIGHEIKQLEEVGIIS